MKRASVLLAILSLAGILILSTVAAEAGGPHHKGFHKKHWHGKHGHWGHGHGGWHWGHGHWDHGGPVFYVAKAKNARGARYQARGGSPWVAKKKALRKCRYDSFHPGTCHIVRIKKVLRSWAHGF